MKCHRLYPMGIMLSLLSLGACKLEKEPDSSEPISVHHAKDEPSLIEIKKGDSELETKKKPETDVPLADGNAVVPVSPTALPKYGGPPRMAGSDGGNVGNEDDDDLQKTHKDHDLEDTHMLLHWNEMAMNASGIDSIQTAKAIETLASREQFGPTRASRALAIVHIAMFEVANAIKGGYESYTGIARVKKATSMEAALAQAAHDTLVALFPSQAQTFDAQLFTELDSMANEPTKQNGVDLGRLAAQSILSLRTGDGSEHPEPKLGVDFFTSDDPGKWRQDPISQSPVAMGAKWNLVKPFVMQTADQFRAPVPPAITSPEYAIAFDEVKRFGGDGVTTPTERTTDQTDIGIFWAYDGTPSLCAPPRLYNQIVVQIAQQMGTKFIDLARLLALVNVAIADAAIAIWESKYVYEYWRPITGIRESDPGTGPSGLGDGNDATVGDITFSPLGSPASNLHGPNFTPPFPAYPSGHAGFGGAVFQILRKFFKTDNIRFTFVSDELNGSTHDNTGNPRPLKPRTFTSFSQAEEENGQSRIYLGIHWSFDKTAGIAMGRKIGDYVLGHTMKPKP